MTKTNEEYRKARALEAKKLTKQEADKTAAYINEQYRKAMEELYGNQLDAIDDLARSTFENGYYHSLFSIQKKTGEGWSVNAINKDRLEKVIKRPWAPDGEAFSSRIWKNKAKMINELHTALTQGCITGAPVERVAKQMAERLGVGAGNAERLLRTEATHFATEGDMQGYKDTGVREFQYIAALDHNTCEICAALDNQVIKVSDYQEGVNAPPLHPRCRCTTVPYFNDEFTVDETRAARDENGKTVQIPADMSYSDWKKKFLLEPIGDIISIGGTGLTALAKRVSSADERSKIMREAMNSKQPIYAEDLRTAYNDYGVKKDGNLYDVVMHGTQYYVEYEHEYRFDVETLAYIISGRRDYQGSDIRLLSCSTGELDKYGNCVAQKLANLLKVRVYAPKGQLNIYPNGKLTVGDYIDEVNYAKGFKWFDPQ